jgi:hypothetical protein
MLKSREKMTRKKGVHHFLHTVHVEREEEEG